MLLDTCRNVAIVPSGTNPFPRHSSPKNPVNRDLHRRSKRKDGNGCERRQMATEVDLVYQIQNAYKHNIVELIVSELVAGHDTLTCAIEVSLDARSPEKP